MSRARVPALVLTLAGAAVLTAACGGSAPPGSSENAPAAVPVTGGAGGGSSAGSGTFQIVFLGDSLTSGLGLMSDQAFPALVQGKFAAEGYNNVETVNAGISADTSAGGLRRVEQLLNADTRILVVALGGNDALRGLTVSQTHDNLSGIIDAALNRNVGVLLAGIQPPSNYGEDYRDAFNELFTRLLSEHRGRISLMPFLLEGVAGVPSLTQSDGLHPNADGSKAVAEAIYPRLRTMVDSMGGG